MHGTLRVHSERGHDQVGLAVHQLADQPVPLLFGAVHLEGRKQCLCNNDFICKAQALHIIPSLLIGTVTFKSHCNVPSY